MPIFKPDSYVKSYKYLNIHKLQQKGIRLLLCDIDNTLVAYDDPEANRAVREFIAFVQKNGMEIALMSNNVPSRTDHFARDLDVEKVYSFSLKPMPHTFKKAMKEHNVRADQTALIGDQLFTDILGGNLAGVHTILSAPIVEKDKLETRMMRWMERLVFDWYEKKNIMKRGNFYD